MIQLIYLHFNKRWIKLHTFFWRPNNSDFRKPIKADDQVTFFPGFLGPVFPWNEERGFPRENEHFHGQQSWEVINSRAGNKDSMEKYELGNWPGASWARALWSGDNWNIWRRWAGHWIATARVKAKYPLGVIPGLCNFSVLYFPYVIVSRALNIRFLFGDIVFFSLSFMTFITTRKGKEAVTRFCLCITPNLCTCFAFWPVKPPIELTLFHRSWNQLSPAFTVATDLEAQCTPIPPTFLLFWGLGGHQDSLGIHVIVKAPQIQFRPIDYGSKWTDAASFLAPRQSAGCTVSSFILPKDIPKGQRICLPLSSVIYFLTFLSLSPVSLALHFPNPILAY